MIFTELHVKFFVWHILSKNPRSATVARNAVERRRQYMFSLLVTILMPIMTLVLLVGPFLLTSWEAGTDLPASSGGYLGYLESTPPFSGFATMTETTATTPRYRAAYSIRRRPLLKLPMRTMLFSQ
jgi:hypothetical protein